MEQKRIKIENSRHQMQEFGIDEYDDHIVLGAFLSRGIENVEIPDEIEGKAVVAIGGECFFNCEEVKTVNFPQSIESIGAQAFALCKGLTELILPDSVTEIGHHAFRDCRGLKKVVLPKSLKRVEAGLFSFCYLQDPEIILPEGLEVIEEGAFCSAGVFDLVIPESVKKIGIGTFMFGPHPITRLPEDKGWYLHWPYGESVVCSEVQGIITDLHCLEEGCTLHEVIFKSDIKQFVYPCDYIDGFITFVDEKNQQGFLNDIKYKWKTQDKLEEAYKIRDAWHRGFIELR